MRNLINGNLLKMNTEEFLDNIKKAFNDVFSDGNIEKTDLMGYLSENKFNELFVREEMVKYKKMWTFTALSARKIWRKKK